MTNFGGLEQGRLGHSTETYAVQGAQRFLDGLERNPRQLERFRTAFRNRAKDIFDSGELGGIIRQDDRVLYLGTGTGHVAQFIEDSTHATLIKLDIADLRTPDTREDRRFIIGDARSLPIQDSRVSVVMMNDMLHHLTADGQERIIAEARRALVPGGKLVLLEDTMPEENNNRRKLLEFVFGKVDDMLNKQPASVNPHQYRSIQEWGEVFTRHGFDPHKDIKSWYWGPVDFLPHPPSRGDHRSLARPFESTRFVFTKPR